MIPALHETLSLALSQALTTAETIQFSAEDANYTYSLPSISGFPVRRTLQVLIYIVKTSAMSRVNSDACAWVKS